MTNVLSVEHVRKCFSGGGGAGDFYAVDDVSFDLRKGEFLGLVGESGCGKSTLSRMIMGLLPPDEGDIRICGDKLEYPYKKSVYRKIQTVFQMPKDSFDPRRPVGKVLTEMMVNFGYPKSEADARVVDLFRTVGLTEAYLKKRPTEMSGGECQRVAIARALTVSPEIVICDECTSALDVSVQAQVVELLNRLKAEMDLSILFISHEISLVGSICENVMVMNQGKIVEHGTSGEVLFDPKADYTKNLLRAVLSI